MCDVFPYDMADFFLSVETKNNYVKTDNDHNIISKIFEFLAKGCEIERSRPLLEIKDANGRAFRYVSMKDWPNESK